MRGIGHKRVAVLLLASGLLVLAALVYQNWSFDPYSGVSPEATNADEPKSFMQNTRSPDALVDHVVFGSPKQVFGDVDATTAARFDPWLHQTYLLTLNHVIRSRLVKIDSQELANALRRSSDAYSGVLPGATAEEVASTDLILNLFDDVSYRVTVRRLTIGASGHLMARAKITEGISGSERVYFEISPNADVVAAIVTEHGMFAVKGSPELPYFVLTEFDQGAINTNFKIN